MSKYDRSMNYRYEYIKNNPGYKGNRQVYHCAYCGKRIKKDQMQVDHIFSVYNAKNSFITRLLMRLFGINGVNDVKNLTASCPKCNLKKGKMGNGWIISGFLGKNIWYHRIKKLIKLALLAVIIYGAYWLYMKYRFPIINIINNIKKGLGI